LLPELLHRKKKFVRSEERETMPKAKRERRERTDNWEQIQRWCQFPEQRLYESIRPVTLYGMTPAEQAQETGMAQQTLRRTADAFDAEGMMSLFRPTRAERASHHRSLPVPMRQLIVALLQKCFNG
jgi:putative transposase